MIAATRSMWARYRLPVLAAFVVCAVQMVEALTIVLAVGFTRSWRSTLYGVAVAVLALVAVVAVVACQGLAVAALPINALRLVVGTLLLFFGLQWLRKAILRAAAPTVVGSQSLRWRRRWR